MSFQQHVIKDRRLTLLLLLHKSAGYEANEHLLRAALDEFGHAATQDQVRGDLAWLAEQELITVQETAGIRIAVLTKRGADVATGRATVPGVKKPTPHG